MDKKQLEDFAMEAVAAGAKLPEFGKVDEGLVDTQAETQPAFDEPMSAHA